MAFLVMASIFAPAPSQAEDHGPTANTKHRDDGSTGQVRPVAHEGGDFPTTDPHEGLRALGEVEDGCYRVMIFSTSIGPRYTIYDADTNAELGALLSVAQVEQYFPDLPLRLLISDDAGALMLAQPLRDGHGH
jgi:hypothetical protein